MCGSRLPGASILVSPDFLELFIDACGIATLLVSAVGWGSNADTDYAAGALTAPAAGRAERRQLLCRS